MAGNNSLQFLRGNGVKNEALLPGQPYYDMQNNKLYIGNSTTNANISTAKPIGLNIQAYWEGLGRDGALAASIGDTSFIELINDRVLSALCVNVDTSGTIWQVSWPEKHIMSTFSVLTWGSTELCTWLNSTVINLFPDYLKNNIASVTKSSGGDDPGISCKLWVPSAEEIWGQNATFSSSLDKDRNSDYLGYYRQLLGNPTSVGSEKLNSNNNCWLRNRVTTIDQWYYLNYSLGIIGNIPVNYNSFSVVFCFKIPS